MNNSDPHRQHTFPSVYAGRPTPQEDISWLDFLRTAGGTVPAEPPTARPPLMDRSDSTDRKRRHTGSEPERRNYPYPTNNGRSSDPRLAARTSSIRGGAGSSRDSAIDSPSPQRMTGPSFDQIMRMASEEHMRARRESDITLPPWQPDTDVVKCPVCQTEFSFWYRKHHCRKCGRVVCSNCSPHRITIPKQYIVQPPNLYEDEANPGSPGGVRGNPALGGGDIVRVCNPCVPDPWTPGNAAGSTSGLDNTDSIRSVPPPPPSRPAPRIPSDPRLHITRDGQPRDANERERPERYRTVSASAGSRTRSYTHQPFPTPERPSPHHETPPPLLVGSVGHNSPYPRISSRYGHRYSQSNVDRSGASHPMPPSRPAPPVPSASTSSEPVRRREVKEEDECPVCGIELPPGESLRESHVQQCIETRFSSTPSQSSRPVPPQEANSTLPVGTPPVVPEGSRPRATSYRPRGMALYKATEKDCTTEDGEPQECVICFEEFEAGDEMGRMECLCKFHRHCIRQWWDTKGAGSCPTHQLHD